MKRVLTALILGPFMTLVIFWGRYEVFAATVAVLASFCWYEFCNIAKQNYPQIPGWAGYIPGIAFLLVQERPELLIILTALFALVVAMRGDNLSTVLPTAGIFLLGIVYIFGAWRTAILLREYSPAWLFFSIVINWIGDSAAYYVGKNFGKNKLAPTISPAKTWEGSIASLVIGSIAAVAVLNFLVPGLNPAKALVVAVIANAFGQTGDLAESAMKRSAGLKDSGNMLPGHGGWLDRVDSSLFSMPVVYVLYPWLGK